MVTAANMVQKLVDSKPVIREALARGIVNIAALAEQFIPEIEKELRKPVKFSAVNMAIRRYQEVMQKSPLAKAMFDENSDIALKSDLIEITLYKTAEVSSYQKLYDVVDFSKGDYLTVTHGINEVMVITNERNAKKILAQFPKKDVKKTIPHLSALTINFPIETIEHVGLFYNATRALSWENIPIVEVVSTLTELTFLIKEEDTGRAFDALKKIIKESQ